MQFQEKNIMSMSEEELKNELEIAKKSVEEEETKKKLRNRVIWIGIALVALINILT